MSELPYGSDVRSVELRTGQSPIGGAWPIVYGRCKVELPIVHLHLATAGLLECIGVVSLGEIDAVEKVFVGETEVYPSVQGWCQAGRGRCGSHRPPSCATWRQRVPCQAWRTSPSRWTWPALRWPACRM